MRTATLLLAMTANLPLAAAQRASSHPKCRAEDGGFDPESMTLTLRPLNDTAATCNDGSQASLYFRPCCDGPTSGDWCNTSASTWLIVFGDEASGWCWDGAR